MFEQFTFVYFSETLKDTSLYQFGFDFLYPLVADPLF